MSTADKCAVTDDRMHDGHLIVNNCDASAFQMTLRIELTKKGGAINLQKVILGKIN